MIEINDGFNKIKLGISNYVSKEVRKINNIDENDYWCELYISIENEYVKIENSYYDLELFVNDKMQDDRSFETIEEAF